MKLRDGHGANGITAEAQDKHRAVHRLVRRCTDFPNRTRPASRCIAYASAYLKCHYLAAFTAAMLNNQPMGFYPPGHAGQGRAAPRPARRAYRRAASPTGTAPWNWTAPPPRPALRRRPARRRRTDDCSPIGARGSGLGKAGARVPGLGARGQAARGYSGARRPVLNRCAVRSAAVTIRRCSRSTAQAA